MTSGEGPRAGDAGAQATGEGIVGEGADGAGPDRRRRTRLVISVALTAVLLVAAAILWWVSRTVVMLPSPVDERPLEALRTDGRLLFAATVCAAAALVTGTRAALEFPAGHARAEEPEKGGGDHAEPGPEGPANNDQVTVRQEP